MSTQLSPQSRAIVDRLLQGKIIASGKITIGPLESSTRTLLTTFLNHLEDLNRLKGEERVRKLRKHFVAEMKAANATTEAVATPTPAYPPSNPTPVIAPQNWRLRSVRCTSIRGIAPPGETFEFPFDGQSCLIYGPNGSGKSSLLSAVIWILTGSTITDSDDRADKSPLYSPSGTKSAGSKLRDWPIVATLPSTFEAATATPPCCGQLSLERQTDKATLHLRRSHGFDLEMSTDGTTWHLLTDLSQIGVEPLDIQLSLVAPTMFGRRSIEDAENTRNILSLMLGFDDLEHLGELASSISPSRTKLANAEKRAVDARDSSLRQTLRLLPSQLPQATASAKAIEDLAKRPQLTASSFDTAITTLSAAIVQAEEHLAKVLGLNVDSNSERAGLADGLTVAVERLSKGFEENFPSLCELRLENALLATGDMTPEERLVNLQRKLHRFVTAAQEQIAQRYSWWQEETAPGSKAALLLTAAQHFNSATQECPVCERAIDDLRLRRRLESLKKLDTALGSQLRTFFQDMTETLYSIVPKAVCALSSRTIQERLDIDWTYLSDEVLGDRFAQLIENTTMAISSLNKKLLTPLKPPPNVLPQQCDDAFAIAAESFLNDLSSASQSIILLTSAVELLPELQDQLNTLLLSNEPDVDSLLTQLAKGKHAATLVRPLEAGRQLAKLRKDQEDIDTAQLELKILETLEYPLDHLKQLSKYAESEVRRAFEEIKNATTTSLNHLYPESSTGMRPGNLRLNTGKDKSVEALLTAGSFDVPGQYFANAGLQRAIALAFYFALLDNHRSGLGFVLMDDPILSLDEEHRERWAVSILRPKLNTLQVVLTTHQRQFLQTCQHDFTPGRIFELNPRDRRQRVSFRPGARLQRAEEILSDGDWLSAAMTMRKFREDVLISLDAYSQEVLFDSSNFAASWSRYQSLSHNHFLAGPAQNKICDCFKTPKVDCVLDPSAHSMTEGDVTQAMTQACLVELQNVSKVVSRELARLESLRLRSLRANVIATTLVPFEGLAPTSSLRAPIDVPLIGATAAKSNPWAIEIASKGDQVQVGPSAIVQVTGESLEPVASFGQWVLLAEESQSILDGDLVAVRTQDGERYLRRIWATDRQWILQSVNAIRPTPALVLSKQLVGVRRIIGVIYVPLGAARLRASDMSEWLPCSSLDLSSQLSRLRAVNVEGDSLAPLARNGQKLLVEKRVDLETRCADGELLIVEFADESLGSVVKQVFFAKDEWVLCSPNPVDRIPPIITPSKDIRAVWYVRGVLFEAS